jgi:hypothetical protein
MGIAAAFSSLTDLYANRAPRSMGAIGTVFGMESQSREFLPRPVVGRPPMGLGELFECFQPKATPGPTEPPPPAEEEQRNKAWSAFVGFGGDLDAVAAFLTGRRAPSSPSD